MYSIKSVMRRRSFLFKMKDYFTNKKRTNGDTRMGFGGSKNANKMYNHAEYKNVMQEFYEGAKREYRFWLIASIITGILFFVHLFGGFCMNLFF